MEVERRIEQVSGRRLVLDLPESFEGRQVEVVISTLEDSDPRMERRHPHPSLEGTMVIHGDIFDSSYGFGG